MILEKLVSFTKMEASGTSRIKALSLIPIFLAMISVLIIIVFFCGTVGQKTTKVSTNVSVTSEKSFISNTTKSTTTTTTSNLPLHTDICGLKFIRHRQKRIVGGQRAKPHDWPWQVFIKSPLTCGASILTRTWIITAAHCLHDDKSGVIFEPSQIKVVLGQHDRRIQSQRFPSVDRSIAQVILHEGYNFTDPHSDFDLALLRLDSPIDFQPHIIPICLPSAQDEFSGREGILTGWGRTERTKETKPSILQQVKLPILSNTICAAMTEWRITQNSLCAGYRNGGKDNCNGDSGGPLTVKTVNDRYVLAGVVSGGPCAQPAGPGIYIRISQFIDWITYHTDYYNYY